MGKVAPDLFSVTSNNYNALGASKIQERTGEGLGVGGGKVVIVRFCWGGGESYMTLLERPDILKKPSFISGARLSLLLAFEERT